MVEDSKRRGRGQRGGSTPASKGRQAHGTAVAPADQDAFAAFTTRYRDMLRFADADEAEAVYSMVSLTQAAHRQQQPAELIKGPVIEVTERRAVKRRPVPLALPAASACSEGGRSDSSAKSAPGPPQRLQQQHWQQAAQHGPSMLAAALGPPAGCADQQQHQRQQQPQAAAYAAEGTATSDGPDPAAAADIHPGALGPMAGAGAGMQGMAAGCMNMSMPMNMPMHMPFFPPGCMPGMMMGAGPGCPPAPFMPPFMPPWGFNPAMMQSMMMRGLPMPPLPMPPPGLMPMPFPPGMAAMMGAAGQFQHAAAAEPAAGIPVTGPMPPAGNAFKATAHTPSAGAGAGPSSSGPASKGRSAPVAAAAAAGSAGLTQTACRQQQGQQPAPATPAVTAAGAAASPSLSPSAARAPAPAPAAAGLSAAAAKAASSGDMLAELEQLDLISLKPWVISNFCEDVYLLLLDVWRPDSAKVREAIWAWKLHLKGPRARGAEPDYRAFLVSLFGLEKLTELTAAAAAAARQSSSALPKAPSHLAAAAEQDAALQPAAAEESGMGLAAAPAAVAEAMTPEHETACAGADCDAAVTTSNLSSEPGAALTAPGPHVMAILVPDRKAGGASATSPHRAQPQGEQL